MRDNNRAPNSSQKPKGTSGGPKPKKLSYKEQKEYDQMEAKILEAETVLETCRANAEDPAVVTDHIRLQEAYSVLKEAEQKVAKFYARWAELEAKHKASSGG